MSKMTTINFHGTKLIAVPGDKPETTFGAMKPIVEGMGLDWGGQHKKMLAHPVLCKGISVTEIPSDGGAQATVCLTLDLLNFWLATIHPDRTRSGLPPWSEQPILDALGSYFTFVSIATARSL